MQKPYKVVDIKDAKDIENLDNLFTILFNKSQGKEFRFLALESWTFSVDLIGEKELVLCKFGSDVRLYTKVSGILKYIQFN